MNKELEKKLVERFPILYQGCKYGTVQDSGMAFGFQCNNGWFDIIWQLSLAIEDELGYTKWDNWYIPRKRGLWSRWNNFIYKLSPVTIDKTGMLGKGTKEDPFRRVVVEKAKRNRIDVITEKILRVMLPLFMSRKTKIDQVTNRLEGKEGFDIVSIKAGSGFKYFIHHPKTGLSVDQVKQKFATLRFYCSGNDRIFRLVNFAEILSSVTCEECGKRGVTRGKGWIKTLCDDCYKKDKV